MKLRAPDSDSVTLGTKATSARSQGSFAPGSASRPASRSLQALLGGLLVRVSLWLLTHTFYRVRVRDAEHLPQRGPALLVCTHISFVDPFLIAASSHRFIRFLMYRPFYQAPWIRWLAKLMGAIPIAETDSPRELVASLREAQRRLREGDLVCIFAEGAVTRAGNLPSFRRGFERVTRRVAVPIIPVHLDRVWGSILSFARGRFSFQWPRRIPLPVTVSFDAPLPPDATAFQVRQALAKLSAEAFSQSDAIQRPLPALFLDAARRNWRRFAMADGFGRKLSFGQALAGALLFRRMILKECSDEKLVGILLPPSVPTALLNIGISLAGRVPANLNYTTSAENLALALERCEIKTILTSEKLLERFSISRRPGMVMLEEVSKGFSTADKVFYTLAGRLLPGFLLRRWFLPHDTKLDSLATVIFSSGSAGTPKGAMLSHRNIVSNIAGIQQAINVDENDRLLGILPFFHSFGFTVALWLPVVSGFGVAFHTNPLEARKVGELCRQYGVTIIVGTPTFVWEYVRRCAPEDFASLRVAIVGAEKMKPDLAQAFKAKFSLDLFQGYGCTELSPVVSVETSGPTLQQAHGSIRQLTDSPSLSLSKGGSRAKSRDEQSRTAGAEATPAATKPRTSGRPIPGVAVRVVHPESFEPLGPSQDGMLLVKGPLVMMGYLREPERTRQAIWEDGWYITGDIARLDEDGSIIITDRLSRFSKIAGEMVSHVQVEDALLKALGSVEPKLVVASLPDEQKGEKLVVLHCPLELSVDDLLSRLRDAGVPKLWIPRKENFFQVPALPILGSGKLDLQMIKETANRLAAAVPASSTKTAA